MAENPYESPQSHDGIAQSPSSDSTPEPRKGAMLAMAIGWNIPIIANFYLLFTGRISDRTSELLLVCWAGTIPLFVLLFAYSSTLQRLIFTAPVDKSRRSAAWVLAIFWAVLSGFGLYSILTGG